MALLLTARCLGPEVLVLFGSVFSVGLGVQRAQPSPGPAQRVFMQMLPQKLKQHMLLA